MIRNRLARLLKLALASMLLALADGSHVRGQDAAGMGYEQKSQAAVVSIAMPLNQAGQVEMRLSDMLGLTLAVSGPATLEVASVTGLTPSKDWQVLRSTEPQKKPTAGNRVLWQQTFTLVPLKPGQVPLSLAPVRYRETPDVDAWREAAWQTIPVHVVTEIAHADLSELRGITGPEDPPPASTWHVPYLWVAGAVGGLTLLLAGGWFYRRRNRRQPMLLPDQWALRELARLALPGTTSDGEVDRFHTQISDVMRRYLELRFQLPALEQTTVEFFEGIRRSPRLNEAEQSLLRDLLERCDLVKFARARPKTEDCRDLAAVARRFVEQTANDHPARNGKETIL
jgi:hypothetical protein